jgi:hypothetical protein
MNSRINREWYYILRAATVAVFYRLIFVNNGVVESITLTAMCLVQNLVLDQDQLAIISPTGTARSIILETTVDHYKTLTMTGCLLIIADAGQLLGGG